jgi:hypothetical protein
MEEMIASARRIVEKDEDSYFLNKLEWIINNLSDTEKYLHYIEEIVENCLNLSVKHMMQEHVIQQLIKEQNWKKPFYNKLQKPTTRTSGLMIATTFTHQCTECHAMLTGPLDACRCNSRPYGEHDNPLDEECNKLCCNRFPQEDAN